MPAAARTPQAATVETAALPLDAPTLEERSRAGAKARAKGKAEGKAVKVIVRRQGGARVMTIPPALLGQLGADTGTEFAVVVRGGKLVAEPVASPTPEPAHARRPRYTLADLLVGAEHLPEVYASVAGTLDGEPVGREIV